MALSCITKDSHRVDKHIPYQRKVPSVSYGANESLWSAKHNEVQNWNFPNCINITCRFISYRLGLPFEIDIITYTEPLTVDLGYSGILKQNKSESNIFLGFDFKSLGTLLKTNFTVTSF